MKTLQQYILESAKKSENVLNPEFTTEIRLSEEGWRLEAIKVNGEWQYKDDYAEKHYKQFISDSWHSLWFMVHAEFAYGEFAYVDNNEHAFQINVNFGYDEPVVTKMFNLFDGEDVISDTMLNGFKTVGEKCLVKSVSELKKEFSHFVSDYWWFDDDLKKDPTWENFLISEKKYFLEHMRHEPNKNGTLANDKIWYHGKHKGIKEFTDKFIGQDLYNFYLYAIGEYFSFREVEYDGIDMCLSHSKSEVNQFLKLIGLESWDALAKKFSKGETDKKSDENPKEEPAIEDPKEEIVPVSPKDLVTNFWKSQYETEKTSDLVEVRSISEKSGKVDVSFYVLLPDNDGSQNRTYSGKDAIGWLKGKYGSVWNTFEKLLKDSNLEIRTVKLQTEEN